MAYASSITALYQWMKRTGRKTKARVACFITMSESFPDDARQGIKDLFGCPVISRYSNQECGLISQQCKLGTEYHINTASFYVEILDLEKDISVEDGKLGRIVVTDLYNKAMPMIRYDTGDLGVMSHECECGIHGKVLQTSGFYYSNQRGSAFSYNNNKCDVGILRFATMAVHPACTTRIRNEN